MNSTVCQLSWELFSQSEDWSELEHHPTLCELHKLFISPLPGGCFYPRAGALPGLVGSPSVHAQLRIQPKTPWVPLCRVLELLLLYPQYPTLQILTASVAWKPELSRWEYHALFDPSLLWSPSKQKNQKITVLSLFPFSWGFQSLIPLPNILKSSIMYFP